MSETLVITDKKPLRAEGVLIDRDPSGAITVLNPMTGRSFVINEVARRILELSNGTHAVDEIIDTIVSEFRGSHRSAAEHDVYDFLLGCLDAHIIDWND